MELFEYDILNSKPSRYETNHLHMYVEGRVTYPDINTMSDHEFSIFLHEYVHYIQHLTTLMGIRICDMNQRLYLLYRGYFESHEDIPVPLHLWNEDHNLFSFREMFRKVSGSQSCPFHIDEVEVKSADIIEAKRSRTAVSIGCLDYENDKVEENAFQFGYRCVIEGMAHEIQQLFYPDVQHSVVPYTAVELILKSRKSRYKDDSRMIASICLCALHWDNPGVGFFEVLDILEKYDFTNGVELYQHVARDYAVEYNGETMPRFRLMQRFLVEIKKDLEVLLGVPLKYYNKVFDSCINEAGYAESYLLKLLYEENLNDKNGFCEKLIDFYGIPTISAEDMIILPRNHMTGKPYLETASLLGWELIIRRILEKDGDTACGHYKICSENQYTEPDKCLITEDCMCRQWKKTEKCLFTQALHYYGMDRKKFSLCTE